MDVLRHRILLAMGLSPLGGCAGSTVVPQVEPPDAEVPTVVTPAASFPEPVEDEVVLPTEAPAVTPDPVLTLRNGPMVRGHVAVVSLSGWLPNAEVRLRGIEPLTQAVAELAAGRSDAEGRSELRVWAAPTMALGRWQLTVSPADTEGAAAVDAMPVGSVLVSEVTPDFADVGEMHPGTTDAELLDAQRMRACVPSSSYDACPEVEQFHAWQVAEVIAYALDRPLLPGHPLALCAMESAFEGSCCYLVATWMPGEPAPDNVCGLDEERDSGWWWGGEVAGRPFRVHGASRTAAVRAGAGWCDAVQTPRPPAHLAAAAAAGWRRLGQAEHASVASFARLTLELLSLGAPAGLVARSVAAQADEVRHATLCFGLASVFGGAQVGPGPLDTTGALASSGDLRAIITSAVVEGCVQETISAAQVRYAATRAADPSLAAALHAVADDEARHAELSWALVRWALGRHPELREAVARAFEVPWARSPGPAGDELAAWGLPSAADEDRIARQAFAEVVAPCARALLAEPVTACA